ncbi:hypothetical protein [Qipengyuania vesicularis]|uniref:hypothetical protein n=1 Tax=Qipengyuania vesicularis TaxID=2867232 RepID=UPI001C886D98|nr:hypothetical protein [Qipengyuania vesicularis]MBX7527039.1 hypothetical protein [Qipengyuania vesicularis]
MRDQQTCCANGHACDEIVESSEDRQSRERLDVTSRILAAASAVTLSAIVIAGYFAVPTAELQSAGHGFLF